MSKNFSQYPTEHVLNLNEFEIGWIAGLLEGEGTFVVSFDPRRKGTYNVKIQVEMTDKDTIEKLNSIYPGRVWESNYPSKYKRFPNAKPSWRWAISSKDKTKELATIIYPHMSSRRKEQLDRVLEHSEYKRNLIEETTY